VTTRLELHTGSDAIDVGTARTFAAAVGRTAGLAEDAVDHLRMAVSEVATAVVEFDLGPIEMRVEVDEGQLSVTTSVSHPDERLASRLVLVTRLPFELAVEDSSIRLTMSFAGGSV
jgi:hypothetical protein